MMPASERKCYDRGVGVLEYHAHGRSRMTIDPRILQCRDGARRVFTDQANFACTKRCEVFWASHIEGELHPTVNGF